MDNNPSPGNKAGGLTTIYEKSLGAVSKGGTTRLVDVVDYAQPVESTGLVFMDTPGYDVVSITGMIAGGANLIGFTTGRGTVCGFAPVPTIKLASNTPLYRRMSDDMDIDCGSILEIGISIHAMGEAIFKRIIDVASGTPTQSEHFGYGALEFVPWPMGAVL
jgi:altronate dehydratase